MAVFEQGTIWESCVTGAILLASEQASVTANLCFCCGYAEAGAYCSCLRMGSCREHGDGGLQEEGFWVYERGELAKRYGEFVAVVERTSLVWLCAMLLCYHSAFIFGLSGCCGRVLRHFA